MNIDSTATCQIVRKNSTHMVTKCSNDTSVKCSWRFHPCSSTLCVDIFVGKVATRQCHLTPDKFSRLELISGRHTTKNYISLYGTWTWVNTCVAARENKKDKVENNRVIDMISPTSTKNCSTLSKSDKSYWHKYKEGNWNSGYVPGVYTAFKY